MKHSFEISQLALKDLDDIWHYTIKHWSKQQANKYYKEIFAVIEEICNNSEMGKSIDEIKIGHRRVNVKSNMIIYIDRILHKKMDIENHLNEQN